MHRGEYSGVEVDCYSRGFNRKVQLLLHFKDIKIERAEMLICMLKHTFKYRSSQLYEYLGTLLEPAFEDRLQEAGGPDQHDEDIVGFVRIQPASSRTCFWKTRRRFPTRP
jgi:hypothetical protein